MQMKILQQEKLIHHKFYQKLSLNQAGFQVKNRMNSLNPLIFSVVMNWNVNDPIQLVKPLKMNSA